MAIASHPQASAGDVTDGHDPADVRVVFGITGDLAKVMTFQSLYEVLLHAAIVGDSTRFTRQDSVEQTWRVLEPLLDPLLPVQPYAKGSWGPAAADRLVAHHGGWHGRWVAS